MKATRNTEEKIIGVLREAEARRLKELDAENTKLKRSRPMPRIWPNPFTWPACRTEIGWSRHSISVGEMMSAIQSNAEDEEPAWVGEVIRFWFEELTASDWFKGSDDVDTQIRNRFLMLHERLVAKDGPGVTAPRPLLGAVIILDQFSRNLFRGTPRAFAADSIARRLSKTAIERGFDAAMETQERLFLYLPYTHSEDREDQALSFQLFEHLGNEEWLRHALAHKVVIDRFGRFPHRNAMLNRTSTAEEIALLKEPMAWF